MSKKTNDEYVSELAIKNPNIKALETYIDGRTPILHKCLIHDINWKISPYNALKGQGCKKCKSDKIKAKKRKSHEQYVEQLKELNPNIIAIGKYVNAKTLLRYKCLACGNEWETNPEVIKMGSGCPACAQQIRNEKSRRTNEEFISELAAVNPNIEPLEEYQTANVKISYRCKVDGHIWRTTPASILSGCGCPKCANKVKSAMFRKKHSDFVEEVKIINPYIDVISEYMCAQNPVRFKCLIDGYEWETLPGSILAGHGCPMCAGNARLTHDEYVQKVHEISPHIKVVGEYVNAKTKIPHLCTIHNITWDASPTNILRGCCGCPKCMKKKIALANTYTQQEYVEKVAQTNPNVEVIGEYINAKTPILHKCLIHNITWSTVSSVVLSGCGCPKCRSEKISNGVKKTNEEYLRDVKNINRDVIPLEPYLGAGVPILHRCLVHNVDWKVTPTQILLGYGCPKCRTTKGERLVMNWLDKNNIRYEYQKRFDDCVDVKPLPFDFYLPDCNTVIEYDGIQHFEPNDYFSGVDGFKYTVRHDVMKNAYCKDKGIILLRIPYFKDVEEELNNFSFI